MTVVCWHEQHSPIGLTSGSTPASHFLSELEVILCKPISLHYAKRAAKIAARPISLNEML